MAMSTLINQKIKSKLKFVGIVTTSVAISLGSVEVAQALNFSSSGVWNSITGNPSNFDGLGTNEISWGIAANSNSSNSSYVFDGVNNLDLELDGTTFQIGTFSHNNFPIYPRTITGSNLALNLDIENVASQTFNLFFEHDETPNGSSSGQRYCGSIVGWQQQACQDVVSIPSLIAEEQIEIDGDKYQLVVSGFYQNDELTTQFITEENKSNTAKLYARLQKVPEPATGLGLLAIGAVGTLSLKNKNKQSLESRSSRHLRK